MISATRSVITLFYSDTCENAWLLAATLFGMKRIVSVESIGGGDDKFATKSGLFRFWTARLRKYARLAGVPSKHFLLYRTRAKKAYAELMKLSRDT